MVKPGKAAAASGGRGKALAAQIDRPTFRAPTKSLVTRIDRGNGRQEIVFPPDWHDQCKHSTGRSRSNPQFRDDWHSNT